VDHVAQGEDAMSDMPSTWVQSRAALSALPVLGKAGIACALLAITLLIGPLWDFGAALVGPRPIVPAVEEEAAAKTGDRAAAFEGYVAQISGRNLFFNPRTYAQPVMAGGEEAPAPSKPVSYAGPAIVAMVFDEVWFANGKRLRVGEDDGEIGVVAMDPPWSATLAWRGVEFKVDLFTRFGVVLKDDSDPRASPEPQPAPEDGGSVEGAASSRAGETRSDSPSPPTEKTPGEPPPTPTSEPNNQGGGAPSSRNGA
jgi:hypothetical protein